MRTTRTGFGRAAARASIALFLAAALPAAAIAQASAALPAPGQTLTLDVEKAVSLALANNLSLQSNRIDVAQKKRTVDTAWNVFIPTVDVSGTLSRFNTEKSISGLAPTGNPLNPVVSYSVDLPEWSASASLSAQLMLNIAVFEGIRNLKLDYEAGVLTYDQAKVKLERDVRKGYYSIKLLEENILLMEETLAEAERRVKQAQDNFRAGLVPELTVLQARVASANLKPALEEMRNGLDASIAGFAMNLGVPRGVKLVFAEPAAPDFVDLSADALIAEAATDNPGVQSLLASIRSIESLRRLTFNNMYTPTLILGWNFDPAFQGDPFADSWLMEDGWKQNSGMFRATVSYRLNGLLPFTKEALGLTELDEAREKLSIGLAQAVRGSELEIDSLVRKLDKSRNSVDALALNVELAERAYRLSEEAYQAGAKDLLDVQNAELELRKARLEVVKEKFNYMTGLLDLEYAVGLPFGSLTKGK